MNVKNFHAGHALLGVVGFFAVCVGCVAVAENERPRLVGLGCGPDHATLIAVNEDDFPPPCYVVDTPQNLCGTDDALSCANYMGKDTEMTDHEKTLATLDEAERKLELIWTETHDDHLFRAIRKILFRITETQAEVKKIMAHTKH